MHRRALLSGFVALAACGPRRLPPPPSAPRLASAAELLPPDLDVVVRLDMARVKAALGSITPELLSRDVLARASGEGGGEPDALLVKSLLDAELVYLAYRPNPQLLPLDRVLAVEGRFEPLLRAPPGFEPSVDLGGDVRYWEVARGAKPLSRSSVARLYALGERVRAFVSEAELDAVERLLQGLSSPRRLNAPEEGSLSISLRPSLLGRLARGTLRELLEAAQSLEAVIELESDGAKLQVTLLTAEPAHAEQLEIAAREVLARTLAERAIKSELNVVGERLTLALRMSRAQLLSVFACLPGASPSAATCTW